MQPAEAAAIFAAGMGAGAVNAVVGSGSLITFPTLLAFGFPPVVANVSNNIGLVPGNISAVYGYRRELAGQRRRLAPLLPVAAAGALAGAALLLRLSPATFTLIVPALILIACVLVLVQPRLSAWVAARQGAQGRGARFALGAGVFLSAMYGGYFGAAQGVLVIGLLGTMLPDSLQRVNAAKNVLVTVVNGAAALAFVTFAHVAWLVVPLIAAGSTIGGLLGARLGRRLPPIALRIFVVFVGIVASVKLIFF